MAKSRVQKTDLLDKYKDIIENKKGFLLVNSNNIDTATVTDLKIELKNVGANFAVLKNTIFKIALQDTDQDLAMQDFDGPTAIIHFEEEPTAAAKLVKEVQKEHELLDAKCGVFEGQFLTAEKIMQLADIPSREVLLSQLVGTLNAPLTGFMNAVTGNVKGFTMVLKGISEKEA